MKKIICKQCGSVNTIDGHEGTDFVSSKLPDDFDWFIPMKKTISSDGGPAYISQSGESMSREEYIRKYNIDPDIAHTKMKPHIGMNLED